MYRPFFGAHEHTFLGTVLVTMVKMNTKKPYKTPVLGKISVLRTEMTIRIPCFRKIVGRPLVWCLFLLHFFHKKNLGMGFLEYIMSSSKWKYFYSASILGHIVIYYILQMIKYLIIIHYKNIF